MATSSSGRTPETTRDELLMRPADDPSIEQAENLLRRLPACKSPEDAAHLAAHELPALVGADWATFTPASVYAGDPAGQPHGQVAAAALADRCVYSQGEPPTVAAVPVRACGAPAGVILMGRAGGLCMRQLRMAALVAQHAGAVAESLPLARTA
ncbi:MAG TPA: hypothetical protein VFX13_17720 [Gaiellales bacterium]|nr:hypothetical protein [Gaiellales bacterium]